MLFSTFSYQALSARFLDYWAPARLPCSMVKRGRSRSVESGRLAATASKKDTSKTTTAAAISRPSPPHASPSAAAAPAAAAAASAARDRVDPSATDSAMSSAQAEKKKKKNSNKKKKQKRKRQDDIAAARGDTTEGIVDHSAPQESPRSSPPPASSTSTTAAAVAAPPSSKKAKHKRIKEKPARFVNPQLDAELHRLRRPWLSPGDPLFESALETSYKGMKHLPADSLPPAVHKGFRQAFDGLHEAGLFLYDTVQAGGKRLSRTFVTRTLVGDPGITYKYLGLRLFAHPWDQGTSDFRKGPGDGLADSLKDPCLLDLFPADGASNGGGGGSGSDGGTGKLKSGSRNGTHGINGGSKTADTLRKVGDLSEWMRIRAAALLENHTSKDKGLGGDAGRGEGGSCAFNLTLINRMECSSAKRDLKPDPLFAMGKCSVSWHADSCLQDFSTIGVYHCTEPVPAEPDWGIALRVSKEAEGRGGGGDGDGKGNTPGNTKAAKRMEAGATAAVAAAAATAPQPREQEVLTPPLLVPLESGDAYFLLDDFNHFHEHAVVSGSSSLRYSSTHRVADTDGNTFSHVQKRCEEVLAGNGGLAAAKSRRILDLVQVRAEQALLTELESEWLNQFWVQGRRHAALHPWWRGPMALVLATWRELERRTASTVQRLMSLRDEEGFGNAGGAAEPAAITKAFETVLRALEERRESRSRWGARFTDPAYRSLSPDCSPVVPALWPVGGGGEGPPPPTLPRSLAGVISCLRECYTVVYRAASGGKKAGSAKAIAAGAASNWELFRAAAASRPSPGGGKAKEEPDRKRAQQAKGGRGAKKKRKRGGGGGGGVTSGGGGGGRRR